MLTKLLWTSVAAAAMAIAPWLAAPAAAACGLTTDLVASAEVVFIGTLMDASEDGTAGRFDVEDVWTSGGMALASPVTVAGQAGQFTMPPAGVPAQQYLILATAVAGVPTVTGNNCGSWAFPWDDTYAVFRPAGAPLAGDSESDPSGGIPAAVIAVAAAAVLLIAVGFFAFRRASPG